MILNKKKFNDEDRCMIQFMRIYKFNVGQIADRFKCTRGKILGEIKRINND